MPTSGLLSCFWGVGCLRYALYSLKQSPHARYAQFQDVVLYVHFQSSTHDSAQFVGHNLHDLVFLLLYVDDIIVTSFDCFVISEVKHYLFCKFEMKDSGQLWYFLRVEVAFSREGYLLLATPSIPK